MRISKALSQRLCEIAFELRASGAAIDEQAAKWILAHEGQDRRKAASRKPKRVRVRLKQGGEAWLPLSVVRQAEREDQDD